MEYLIGVLVRTEDSTGLGTGGKIMGTELKSVDISKRGGSSFVESLLA